MRERDLRARPAHASVRGLALSLLATLFLGGVGPSRAQEETVPFEPKLETFSEIVEVHLINVEVGVVDREGRPVLGLTVDDFEIREEGTPVEVTNFYAVESGARLVPGSDAESSTEPGSTEPSAAGAAPAAIEAEAEPSYLAVLFDNSQIEGRHRDRLVEDLERFLERQGQGDHRILIASLGEEYTVHQGFTNDSRDLRRALDELRRLPATRGRDEASIRVFIRSFEGEDIVGPGASRLDASARRSEIEVDRLAAAERDRVQSSLGAMEFLMATMAGLPGRKSLLYVSDGLSLRPGQSLYHMLYNRYSYRSEEFDEPLVERPEIAALKYDLTPRFEKLVAFGQTNQVTLFAIDAAGQRAPYAGGAGSGRGDIASFDAGGGNPVWDQRLDLLRTQNLQEGLRLAADETGGAVFANTRAYEAFLDEIRSQLDNYYSLGYPTDSTSAEPRKIEVRVKNRDWKVRHLEGVVYKDRNAQLTDVVVAQLLHGEGTNPLALAVETDSPRRDGKTRIVPIRITMPLSSLTFLPQDDRHMGSATVVLMTSDGPGRTSPPQRIPLRLALPGDEYPPPPERLAEATIEIQVRPGEQTLGVALRDEIGQVTASTHHEFNAR